MVEFFSVEIVFNVCEMRAKFLIFKRKKFVSFFNKAVSPEDI